MEHLSIHDILTSYVELKEQEKEVKKRLAELKTIITDGLEENQTIQHGDFIISFTPYRQDRFDTARFKDKEPELFEKYVYESISTRLVVKKN